MTDLRLMTVHAHPDDESSKGAATVAKYKAQGVSSVLVCCTGGEAGEILNPSMNRPEILENLSAVRRAELETATRVIGYDRVIQLGYRDSGMPGTPENADLRSFARADLTDAVGRLVAAIRETRPHVVVTYADDQEAYPHPDHLRVHDITGPAFNAAADPLTYPDAGEPWQPLKLYYVVWARARVVATHERLVELGVDSPFAKFLEGPDYDHRITTQVDITGYGHVRSEALRAHATQIDPESPLWFGVPDDVAEKLHPFDDYILATSHVDTSVPEDDLFAGVREYIAG